jgi:catechol 2,3-dioxygenase-like lactoylglutathione lyase family enzyme
MDRINHVKIVSPDPDAIDRFLREVLDVPEGWPLGPGEGGGPAPGPAPIPAPAKPGTALARDAAGAFTEASVLAFRGDRGQGGRITGSSDSRQFQILAGERAHIWAVAIGTRNLERAHQRCRDRGVPCTDLNFTEWGPQGGIRFFFAEVGGIVFEVMRVER